MMRIFQIFRRKRDRPPKPQALSDADIKRIRESIDTYYDAATAPRGAPPGGIRKVGAQLYSRDGRGQIRRVKD